jgi:hypothetical protein
MKLVVLLWVKDFKESTCRIATAVDAEAFRELFFERIAALP